MSTTMVDRRTLLTIAMMSCLVLAGCMGGGAGDAGESTTVADRSGGAEEETRAQDDGDVDGGMDDGGAAADQAEPDAGDGVGNDVDDQRPEARQTALIRTGRVRLRVEDYQSNRDRLADRARSMGGYVDASDETLHREDNRTWETGYIVVRVPNDRFAEMMEIAKSEGTVVASETETRDVSDRLVDLEARIDNLEARRDRLRTFYERANTTEELLRIEERLSEVQGEIERLRAQKRELEDQVSYSTIRIEIREPEPEPETTTTTTTTTSTAYPDRSPVEAFTDSVALLVTVVRAGVVSLAYATPFLVLAAIPVAGLVGVWRRRSRVLDWIEQFL